MKFFTFLLFSIACTTAFGESTNVRAGSWSEVTMWSNNTIPNINDTVSLSFDIVIDVNATCKVFHANGHNVTVNTGFNLNIVGTNVVPDSSFTDNRDGQVYTFRHIGTQVWMTKNLNYAGALCYGNDPANCTIYGPLYDWNNAAAAVPQGWHLPSKTEWDTLINFLGGQGIAGGKMKDTGTLHWQVPNTAATNNSGFTGLPGGFRDINGTSLAIGYIGAWWSSMPINGTSAYRLALYNTGSNAGNDYTDKSYGYSVRCIRD